MSTYRVFQANESFFNSSPSKTWGVEMKDKFGDKTFWSIVYEAMFTEAEARLAIQALKEADRKNFHGDIDREGMFLEKRLDELFATLV